MTLSNKIDDKQHSAINGDLDVNVAEKLNSANTGIEVVEAMNGKKNRAARTSLGLKWVAAGALLGFFSCVCSICNPIESLYYVNLYGVSTMAVLIAFYGLYLIFE